MQQAVPANEVCPAPKEWLIFVDCNSEKKIKEFFKRKEAITYAKNRMGIVIDVKNNKVVQQTVYKDNFHKCKTLAIENGYFVQSTEEEDGSVKDIFEIFKNHFNMKTDAPLFLITLFSLTSSTYLSTYTDVLFGNTSTLILYNTKIIFYGILRRLLPSYIEFKGVLKIKYHETKKILLP